MGARVNVRVLARPGAARTDAFVQAVPSVGWSMGTSVLDVCRGDLVIARQFAWPYPRQLDIDVQRQKGRLLNDARAFAFCDDIPEWTVALGEHTPRVWVDFSQLPDDDSAGYILKGHHADKARWSRMFARGKAKAIALRSELWRDTGMAGQTIVAREYAPLRCIGRAPFGDGCPPCEEWRVFALDGEIIGSAPYWPVEDCDRELGPAEVVIGVDWLQARVNEVREACPSLRWLALDVGRCVDGRPVVVEVSDGQRAGIPDAMTPTQLDAMMRRMAAKLGGGR